MGFPTEDFTVTGDPGAIRETARKYSGFGSTLGTGATNVRNLDTGDWIGSEADTFRTQVGKLPDPLQTAADAFGEVAAALTGFANQLQQHQATMDKERPVAEAAYNADVAAQNAAASDEVMSV